MQDNTHKLYLIHTELVPQSYLTSGLETASLLSSDAQTAFLSGHLFSEVILPTPVPAQTRLPEYHTAEHARPPTPNFADYRIRVDGTTTYDPKHYPRFSFLNENFISNNNFYLTNAKRQNLKDSTLLIYDSNSKLKSIFKV